MPTELDGPPCESCEYGMLWDDDYGDYVCGVCNPKNTGESILVRASFSISLDGAVQEVGE